MEIRINLGPKGPRWNKQSRLLAHAVRGILEQVAAINHYYLMMHQAPPLYESGVRYREEPPGTTEEFATIPVILARGHGDCDDLAPYRVAELRMLGEHAQIRLQWKKSRVTGKRMYHVVVRRADGRIEDPSKLLGMNSSS